jgi:hypothetical protein
MSDMAAAGNDGGQDAGQQQQAGPDLSALASQMESLTSGQEELRQFMQQFTAQPEEQQVDPYAYDPAALAGYEDPAGADPDVFAQQVEQRIQQALQQQLAPMQEQLQQARVEREADALVGEFPELAEPEIAQKVVGLAKQMAEQNGRPELANEPWFWRMAYMAGRAAENANTEGRDAPQAAHLEGGGGATPAGSQVNPADLFGQGPRRGGSVLPF